MPRKSSPESDEEQKPTYFDEVWRSLEAVFRTTLKGETKAEWQKQLGHIPEYAVKAAAKSISQNEDKMPSLGLIIRYSRNFIESRSFPRHSEGVDDAGTPCWYWEDEGGRPAYKAQDCPEGREFLAKLKQLSIAKDLKKAGPEKGPFAITQQIVEKVMGRKKK